MKRAFGEKMSKEVEHAEENVRDDPEDIGIPHELHEQVARLEKGSEDALGGKQG